MTLKKIKIEILYINLAALLSISFCHLSFIRYLKQILSIIFGFTHPHSKQHHPENSGGLYKRILWRTSESHADGLRRSDRLMKFLSSRKCGAYDKYRTTL